MLQSRAHSELTCEYINNRIFMNLAKAANMITTKQIYIHNIYY